MNKFIPSLDVSKLKPCINEKGFELHYTGVYSNHVKEFNHSENTDFAYHKAACKLHELYFQNIMAYKENNAPYGKALELIQYRYDTYENFLTQLYNQADRLQGSGWVYMNNAGYINIIPNNRLVENIALIIDLWEHAYVLTHGANRKEYISSFLGVINWDVVNARLLKSKKEE